MDENTARTATNVGNKEMQLTRTQVIYLKKTFAITNRPLPPFMAVNIRICDRLLALNIVNNAANF